MLMTKLRYGGPIVLAILDGVGLAPNKPGNAVYQAKTPFLARATRNYPHLALEASGEAVGLLPNTMGNSEVGHNTIGTGRIVKRGIARIEQAFEDGSIWQSNAWQDAIEHIKDTDATLHFAGIFSDGGVHSHIDHLERMVAQAYADGVRKMRIHCVFDGRDVAPQSATQYITRFEKFTRQFADADIRLATGGGRMVITADRYESDWGMVKRGLELMVSGTSNNHFHSATEAVEALRATTPDLQDQYLPDFVIVDDDDKPIGKIVCGDSVIYYDFRADRAVEIATLLDKYDKYDIYFAGLTSYDIDRNIPVNQLIPDAGIDNTLHDFLGENHIPELAIAETVKYGHITYYFNGNSNEPADKEDFIEIASLDGPFDTCPWMKSAEITEAALAKLADYRFVRINYAGGDMVGHLAKLDVTRMAIEAIDLQLARLAKKVDELGGCLIITADHGNAEELLDEHGQPKTSHTTNPVPFVLYDNTENCHRYQIDQSLAHPGLANIASTIAVLLGAAFCPDEWADPLITVL